jgi:hypothetical protein
MLGGILSGLVTAVVVRLITDRVLNVGSKCPVCNMHVGSFYCNHCVLIQTRE